MDIMTDWPNKKILVVGDVMLDKYVWGNVNRISSEAPVPIVLASRTHYCPGGAANVAANLATLGAQPHLVGFVGDDVEGKNLSECLTSYGIFSHNLSTSKYFPTTTKTRIMSGSQQMLRLDTERTDGRPQKDIDFIIDSAIAWLPNCDAVILSDYAKGTLTVEVCQTIIHAARLLDIPILVDPKHKDFSRYKGATTICPNLAELRSAVGDLVDAEKAVVQFDLEFITATLSEKGIAIVRPGNCFIAPAEARKVFDVSGAGDTVIAVLALCLSCGITAEAAARLANTAAGIVVGKVGTTPVDKYEMLEALDNFELSHLLYRVNLWKHKKERIVFTNGCFDLLHAGHVSLLEQARNMGDRLIVAVNSDASVKNLKGSKRPIISEKQRARVLNALSVVDAVIIFNESTPIELIRAIQPDVIVKGNDHDPKTIVGAKEVASWGGRLEIINRTEDWSTTKILEAIK